MTMPQPSDCRIDNIGIVQRFANVDSCKGSIFVNDSTWGVLIVQKVRLLHCNKKTSRDMTKDRAALLQRCHSRTTLHGRSDTTGQKCHDTHKDDGSEGDTSGETMASFPPTRSVVGMAMVEDRRSAPAAVQAVPLIKTRPIALALSSIDVGEKLGEGRFGMVHACTVPAALCGASSDQQFVIKTLKTNLTDDLDRWIRGAADMATEARYGRYIKFYNSIWA